MIQNLSIKYMGVLKIIIHMEDLQERITDME